MNLYKYRFHLLAMFFALLTSVGVFYHYEDSISSVHASASGASNSSTGSNSNAAVKGSQDLSLDSMHEKSSPFADNRSNEPVESFDSQARQLFKRLDKPEFTDLDQYVSFTESCFMDRTVFKEHAELCSKQANAHYDKLFVQHAEKLAAAGDVQTQLLLGLWWNNKVMETVQEHNIATNSGNLVATFNFNDAANQSNQQAYQSGELIKQQALQARRWLTDLAKTHPQAEEAIQNLDWQVPAAK